MSAQDSIVQADFDDLTTTVSETHTDINSRNKVIDVEKNIIRELVRDGYDGGTVVDVGGSWGEVLSGVPPQALDEAVVFDFAASRLRVGHESLPEVDYVGGDAFNLPIADGSASVVICSEVIEHIEDAQGLIDELSRALEPGGTLILSGPSNNILKNVTVRAQIAHSDEPQYLFEVDDPDRYEDLGLIYHLGFSKSELSTLFSNSDIMPGRIKYVLYRGFGPQLSYSMAESANDVLSKPLLRKMFSGHFVATGIKR